MERLHKLLSSQKVLNKYNQAGKGTHRIEADWLSIFYKDLDYGSWLISLRKEMHFRDKYDKPLREQWILTVWEETKKSDRNSEKKD